MAFFVYLFVLVVAAGSVIFGLDLTQSPLQPPPYAAPATRTAYNPPSSIAPAKVHSATAAPVSAKPPAVPVKVTADPGPALAARAQASTDDAPAQQPPLTTASMSPPNHCAIDACASAYRSFRASDCTYQPFGGDRRLCTKAASSSAPARKVATARPGVHHASRSADLRHGYDRRYAERDDDRDSYAQPRRGWAFDLFGDSFGR